MKKTILLFSLLLGVTATIGYSQPKATSKIWNEFVAAQNSKKPTMLLDFSFAGYKHSEEAPPKATYKLFNVCDYGAIPNDHISDREAVEKAILAAEKNGSGVIYFPKGRFHLHKEGEPFSSIFIKGDSIVFRGEGAGSDGTELFMEIPNEPINPNEKWTSSSLFCFSGAGFAKTLTKVVSDAEKGSFSVEVEQDTALKAGDWIRLRLKNNASNVVSKELSPYKVQREWSNLYINGVVVDDYHQIVSVNGRKITFKEPIMHKVDAKDGWTILSFPHIEEIGVENIAFVGNWKDKFIHHKDWLHDGGYKFIEYRNVVNSWIRACRFTDVNEAATVNSSANVSITDCVVTGNLGHNSFHSQGSTRVFMGAIDDQPSQWHSVGVAKTTLGTVIWRVKTLSNSCFEMHASQPRATLFDACEGGFMEGRSGGAATNVPNHLSDLVLWNYKELDEATKEFKFWPTNNIWYKVMPPIIVGFHGSATTFLQSQVAYEESNGKPVAPESLFESQLELRLGKLPQWIVELKQQIVDNNFSGSLKPHYSIVVNNTNELESAVSKLELGDTIVLNDGEYKNIKLRVIKSGSFASPINIKAKNSGKAIFSGDVKVELLANHITLSGVCFKNGARSADSNAALVTVMGDYCKVSQCRFIAFDDVNSAYIATAANGNGKYPQYAEIDRCYFIGKTTPSEMISLNNSSNPMYHKVASCYFSNQNSSEGAAIRVGSDGALLGRCTVENNIFEHQDCDLIVSESKENIFYNNTFMNCRGVFKILDGERQVALNNFFVGTDTLFEYGGMEIHGNNHLIGSNYFNLPRALNGAAVKFYDSASNLAMIKNVFIDVAPSCLGFTNNSHSSNISFIGNLFFAENSPQNFITNIPKQIADKQSWHNNLYNGVQLGVDYKIHGLDLSNASLRYDDSKTYVEDFDNVSQEIVEKYTHLKSIDGITINIPEILKFGCSGSPQIINVY